MMPFIGRVAGNVPTNSALQSMRYSVRDSLPHPSPTGVVHPAINHSSSPPFPASLLPPASPHHHLTSSTPPTPASMSNSTPQNPTIDQIPISSLSPSPTREPAASTLPPPPERPNLWSVLRDAVGKDLTRITIPVFFNEPISFLQRMAEDVEYSHILDRAAAPSLIATPDRMALVAAFMISHYSSTANRASKPFNPLLGETFDLVDPQRRIALVAEQVAHHPPTSALFVQGTGWRYWTAHEIKNRFLGNTLEVWPEGTVHIQFDDGEHYVYEQIHTYVHNIILGELWLDNAGTTTIRELTNAKYVAHLKFKRNSLFFREAKTLGDITGKVVTTTTTGKTGKTVRKITGNWNSNVKVDNHLVWQATPRPPHSHTCGHNMPAWAWRLNPEVVDGTISTTIAKTDSRLRPDQRALEKGLHKLAASEKERLEAAQRKRRKEAEDMKVTHDPLWFELQHDPSTGKKEWKYRHNYFAAKQNAVGSWPQLVPDIF